MNDVALITGFVERLLFGLVNAQLYGTSHTRVREAAREATVALAEHCAERESQTVLLGAVADLVVVEGRPVLGASLSARRLLQRITERGAGGVEFACDVDAADVLTLLTVLARRGGASGHEGANRELQAQGVTRIRFVPPYGGGGSGSEGGGALVAGEATVFSLHQKTVDLLQSHVLAVCQGRELDLGEVGNAVDGLISGLQQDAGFLHALSQYREYDYFSFGHVMRVALLSLEVGCRMHHDPETLRRLGTAALLHDTGKSLVAWEVLHKPGRLDADEMHEMQKHPALGAAILLQNRQSDELAVAAAYGHHCTCDDRSYPRTCGEFHAQTVTRIVKVCDCYEALTAVRPYKRAMTPHDAHEMMRGMKNQFDEEVLRYFQEIVGDFPPGSTVQLNDGSLARVVRHSGDPSRPVVHLLESDGGPIASEDRREVDLAAPRPGEPSAILGAVPQAAAAEIPV